MPLDDDVLEELLLSSRSFPRIRQLSSGDAAELCEHVATKFVRDPHAKWWWTVLGDGTTTHRYGDQDGLEVLEALLPAADEVTLVVTDDESRPWPALRGPLGELLRMLREMRYVEFFVVPPDTGWVVFDTHHNELVVVGDFPTPPGR